MRRRILCYNQSENGSSVEPSEAQVCDVVFANKISEEHELVIVSGGESSWKQYPASKWEPIGVVVIPGEHGVLKDGNGVVNQCGVMSLVYMNYNTPEQGGDSGQNIYWGASGVDIAGKSDGLGRYDSYDGNGLRNYNQVVVVNQSELTIPIGINSTEYIPSQVYIDRAPQWYYSYSTTGAPSPYAGDDMKSGNLNPAYISTDSPSSNANCLSDFKGISNTKIITDLATWPSDWKTASAITNSKNNGYFPAACCCARFKTTGTKAFVDCTTEELKEGTGFWYMPAIGELGYLPPKVYDINNTIGNLRNAYGIGYPLNVSIYHWSSSEYGNGSVRNVSMYNGLVSYNSKAYDYYVRAFMRL